WNVTNVKPVSAGAVSLDPKYGLEPLGAAFVSSRPGGKADHLAMTVRKSGQGDNINLLLVDITQDGFGTVDQAIMELWPTMGKMPVMAGVPGGRFLAIAGNYYHSIRAYSVGDILVKGSKAKPQFFKGVGTAFSFVAFVRNGQDRGLVLREYEEGIEPA